MFNFKNKKWQLVAMLAILPFLLLYQFLLSWDYFYKSHSDFGGMGSFLVMVGVMMTFIVTVILGIFLKNKNKHNPMKYQIKKRDIAFFGFVLPIITLIILVEMMDYYTSWFGTHKSPVTVIVLKKETTNEKSVKYEITTDKFGLWRTSSRFYETVNVGDVLEIQEKESVFMTAIYEKEIRNMSNSGQ